MRVFATSASGFAFMALGWSVNAPTSSALKLQQLGWQPAGPGLVADLEQGGYFEPA